ncbi:MAG TPA: HAMP domain-containing protein [Cycloclasticus sp.]|jgi:nitrogen fixation/metabolism regulation signal transduction histidine kinase|nr:HAMP domain-containing protein [Cycloclasticus sp.]HIL91874.1 HAMP domain-containing protein [Cycloclasticus sp.]
MAPQSIKKRTYLIPAGVLLSLLFSLYLMSHATQSSSQFNELFSSLIVVNIVGTLFLLGLLIANIRWLWKQFKKQAVGSRITARIVLLFFAISVIPTGVVFYFSNQLLHQSIDSWFDAQIDDAMQNSLTLSRRSLDNRTISLIKETRQIASQLEGQSDIFLSLSLVGLLQQASAVELTAFSKQGQIIASTNIDPNVLIPNTPDSSMLSLLRQNGEFIGLEPGPHKGLIVRTLVEIKHSAIKRYLQAIYTVPEDISELASSVEDAYTAYQEFNYLRNSLRFSFTLTLSLVLVFSLLAASWAAFVFARELVAPIRQLVTGTKAVAAGDYEKKLKVGRQDELGFLVNSFNEMTSRILSARVEAHTAQKDAEAQHAYLETVLSHLSNGVLSFDLSLRLKTINQGANQILEQPLTACIGFSLEDIAGKFPELQNFTSLLIDHFSTKAHEWQHEFVFSTDNQKKTLLLKGTSLYATDQTLSGYVLIFDDVTPIIQSQRNAAWSEVAQRLAHEIKNPLTPIQLSAERLQRKLKGLLDDDADKVLKKSTDTIVQQVAAMKSMVNDFSNFAKPPKSKPHVLPIGQLIDDIATLYQAQIKQLNVTIEDNLPSIFADSVRLRQVLINLIKNAQEAISDTDNGQITVSARHQQDSQSIEICIADNGPGVDNSEVEHIFDPYVTSKDKGTGLGLAIVKKIIEEHGGSIRIKKVEPQGANFVIQLPVIST